MAGSVSRLSHRWADTLHVVADSDSSIHRRTLHLRGNTHVGSSGVNFDGDGDHVMVDNFVYAADSTFSVSLWFTRACTRGAAAGNRHYEYLYSHHHSASDWNTSYVDIYIACEAVGGGWSTADGTVQRSWLRDESGTEAMFDFALADAGSVDTLTRAWVHTVLVVSPTAIGTFEEGVAISDAGYHFFSAANARPFNAAYPAPSMLSPQFSAGRQSTRIFDLQTAIMVGGRADLHRDRHFEGSIALLRVYGQTLTAAQVASVFREGQVLLTPLMSNARACQSQGTNRAYGEFYNATLGLCMPLSTCGDLTAEVVAPTPTSDRQCGCGAGYYGQPIRLFRLWSGSDGHCRRYSTPNCTTLPPDRGIESYYELSPRTNDADRVCHPVAPPCTPPTTYESAAPTATSDRVCSAVSGNCPGGQYQSAPASMTADRRCTALSPRCDRATQWQAAAPTTTSDRSCRMLTECQAAQGEFEARAPTATSDRTCYTMAPECAAGEFEVSPPSARSGGARICEALKVCRAHNGTILEYELVAPTRSSDRVCARVSAPCRPPRQYESLPATSSSDRVCAQTRVCTSAQWELVAPTSNQDRQCADLTTCAAGLEYQSRAPSARSDRVCTAVSAPCSVGWFQLRAPSSTADRECTLCPAGTADLDLTPLTPCQACPVDTPQSVPGASNCTAMTQVVVDSVAQVAGPGVSAAVYSAAVARVLDVDQSYVTIVRYSQTVTDQLVLADHVASDMAGGAGHTMLQRLRSAVARTLQLPIAAVTVRPGGRRRRQQTSSDTQGGSPAVAVAQVVWSSDISGLFGRRFAAGVSNHFSEPVKSSPDPTVSTAIETRIILPSATATDTAALRAAEGQLNDGDVLTNALTAAGAGHGAPLSVQVTRRATAEFSSTGLSQPDSSPPPPPTPIRPSSSGVAGEDATMQPQSKSVDGLIMAMAGSIVAVVVIALLCCCMHRCRKSRPYDERKMTRLEEGASTRESVLYAFRLVGIADD